MTLQKLISCLAAIALATFIAGCNKGEEGDAPATDPAPPSDLGESGDPGSMTTDDDTDTGANDDDDANATTDDDATDTSDDDDTADDTGTDDDEAGSVE